MSNIIREPMETVGVDIGFGYTKAYKDEEFCIIPSHVCFYQNSAFQSSCFVQVNETQYTAGKEALYTGLELLPVTRADFFGSNEYFALMGKAISEVTEASKVKVITGLPPGVFSEKTIEFINQKAKTTSILINKDNETREIKLTEIVFMPQGLGAYISYLKDTGSSPQGNVVVVDVGHFTVDFVLIIEGKYAFAQAVSYPIGMKTLYDAIKEAVSRRYGVLVPDDVVPRILRSSEFSHFGVSYSYEPSSELKNYKELLLSYMKSYASRVGVTVDKVLLTGGGVVVLRKMFTGGEVVNYPQIANARGYYIYGKQVS